MSRILLFVGLILYVGCASDIALGYPSCINDKIKDFRNSAVCETGREVSSYMFQGDTVYVFSPGTCGADLSSGVYDSDCNEIGFLGGFIGNTVINGDNFTKAEFIETIWSD
ncbi:MAG: hypothetical protein ABFS32_12280 [Bacteroidota bacterium]